jgi:hypothetical protein
MGGTPLDLRAALTTGAMIPGPAVAIGTALLILVAAAAGTIFGGSVILDGKALTFSRWDNERRVARLDDTRSMDRIDQNRVIKRRR